MDTGTGQIRTTLTVHIFLISNYGMNQTYPKPTNVLIDKNDLKRYKTK